MASRSPSMIAVFWTADDLLPGAREPRGRVADADALGGPGGRGRHQRSPLAGGGWWAALAAVRRAAPSSRATTSAAAGWRSRSTGPAEPSPVRVPAFYDDIAPLDSTPVECGRPLESARRSQLADARDYRYRRSHTPVLLGHAPAPRALSLQPADRPRARAGARTAPGAQRRRAGRPPQARSSRPARTPPPTSAARVYPNHRLGRPSRSPVTHIA